MRIISQAQERHAAQIRRHAFRHRCSRITRVSVAEMRRIMLGRQDAIATLSKTLPAAATSFGTGLTPVPSQYTPFNVENLAIRSPVTLGTRMDSSCRIIRGRLVQASSKTIICPLIPLVVICRTATIEICHRKCASSNDADLCLFVFGLNNKVLNSV